MSGDENKNINNKQIEPFPQFTQNPEHTRFMGSASLTLGVGGMKYENGTFSRGDFFSNFRAKLAYAPSKENGGFRLQASVDNEYRTKDGVIRPTDPNPNVQTVWEKSFAQLQNVSLTKFGLGPQFTFGNEDNFVTLTPALTTTTVGTNFINHFNIGYRAEVEAQLGKFFNFNYQFDRSLATGTGHEGTLRVTFPINNNEGHRTDAKLFAGVKARYRQGADLGNFAPDQVQYEQILRRTPGWQSFYTLFPTPQSLFPNKPEYIDVGVEFGANIFVGDNKVNVSFGGGGGEVTSAVRNTQTLQADIASIGKSIAAYQTALAEGHDLKGGALSGKERKEYNEALKQLQKDQSVAQFSLNSRNEAPISEVGTLNAPAQNIDNQKNHQGPSVTFNKKR